MVEFNRETHIDRPKEPDAETKFHGEAERFLSFGVCSVDFTLHPRCDRLTFIFKCLPGKLYVCVCVNNL